MNIEMEDINKVSVYWTLTNPYDPRYLFKKPSIYLNEIILEVENRTLRSNNVRKVFKPANPARPIKLKEEVFLNLISGN